MNEELIRNSEREEIVKRVTNYMKKCGMFVFPEDDDTLNGIINAIRDKE